MSSEMMDKLNALARQNHVKREPDIVLDDHPAVRYRSGVKQRVELQGRQQAEQPAKRQPERQEEQQEEQQMEQPAADTPSHSALDFLEQNLYRYSGRVYSGKAEEIRLVQAVNPAGEISHVVRQIGKLLREGYRYRDMAVITGDIGSFAGELIHQFDASEIPYFLDDKKSILKNPMVELVRAALETIQKDFSYETVFRYLRTGLVTKPEDERRLDRLENYVIAMGIRGLKRWNTTWEGWYRGGKDLNLEELNQLREEIMAPLTAFIEAFREEGRTVRTMTEAVVRLLEALSVEEKMLDREASFREQGEFGLAKEYGQVYGLVVDLMDRLARLLGDEKVSRREYAEILDAGFSEIKVGLIPAAVDRIVVGDITRTRLDHIRILFLSV